MVSSIGRQKGELMTRELSAFNIMQGLKTRIIGREIIYYSTLPSTMDAAREKAQAGAEEGTVIIAGEQTAGRGRLKRHWHSPQGNIALSLIIRPEIASLPYLIMIASLAVANSVETITGQKTEIKWPNDVLIDGKKVCGILIENELKGNKVSFSIIGIGINTGLKVADHADISDTAVSLDGQKGGLRLKLIQSLFTQFEELYLKLPDGKPIFETWRNSLVTLGKKVKATWGEQVIEGLAEDVDESGELLIRLPDDTLTKVVAGDVTLKE